MGQLIEFPLESGGSIAVAASEDEQPITHGAAALGLGLSELLSRSNDTLEAAVRSIQGGGEALRKQLPRAGEVPDSVEIEFGRCLSAGVRATIANGSDGPNFDVMLRWDRDGS